jgi:hypothetical protein
MAKAKAKVEQPAEKVSGGPLHTFIRHQQTAVEETGKALVSLLPKDFRTHTGNAIEAGKAGWSVLFDGVIDTVEDGLEKVRRSPKPAEGEATKIKVEVD